MNTPLTTARTTATHLRLRIHLTPPGGSPSHMDTTCNTTVPIADLIPHLTADLTETATTGTPHTWHLTRPDGTELAPHTTLADHHLTPGDTLHLAAHPAYTAKIHHHTPDALAHFTPHNTTSQLLNRTALPLAGLGITTLCLAGPAAQATPWWVALAVVIIGALIAAATNHSATTVILLAGAAATIALHWPTTPTLLATLLMASLLITGIGVLGSLTTIATVAAASTTATLATGALWALGGPHPWTVFAATLTLAGLSAHSLAARLCLAATGIRPDDIPATAEADLPDPTPVPETATLGRALDIHAGIAAGAGIAAVTGALLLAALTTSHTAGSGAAAALAVCTAAGIAETLRSRLQARPIPHAVARLSGVVCLFAAAWVGCAGHHPILVGAGVAAAVGGAAVAGWSGAPEGPVTSKVLEWAELTATAAVMPLVLWAADVFAMIRGLG